MEMAMDSPESNPYFVTTAERTPPLSGGGNRRLVGYGIFIFHMSTILLTVLAGLLWPPAVLFFSPIRLLVGLTIFIGSAVRTDLPAAFFGATEIVFFAAVVAMTSFNSWTPTQSERPLLYATAVYACVALPFVTWLTVKRRRENHDAD